MRGDRGGTVPMSKEWGEGHKDKRLLIGDDAVIGAEGCVTMFVQANTTVVGVSAKALVQS